MDFLPGFFSGRGYFQREGGGTWVKKLFVIFTSEGKILDST